LRRMATGTAIIQRHTMTYTYHTVTNKGKRTKNEDAFYPSASQTASDLFVVCDGLGGHGNGDLAAAFVAEKLALELKSMNGLDGEAARAAFNKVHLLLNRLAVQVGNLKMGSTAAFLKLNGKQALIGWVGDSRIYQFRNGEIRFRSTDHTLVELMLQNGQLSKEKSKSFPLRHIIWQAIGPHNTPLQPSIEVIPDVEPGDRFLLATDGLTDSCDETLLIELFKQEDEQLIHTLTKHCTERATDNYTFTVIGAHKARGK
jgi:serine/threonine protein phosphatase PrpC